VDDVHDQPEDEVTRTDLPATRPESSGPATDRVRIVGAEPAGESTSELPAVPGRSEGAGDDVPGPEPGPADALSIDEDDDGLGAQSVRLTDEPADADMSGTAVNPVAPGQTAVPGGGAAPTELPHWTEPPTGQVPAVLAREPGDEEPGSSLGAPSWREEDADWVAHDEEFEPAMLGDDAVALGSLDESDRSDAERRPWEFDLESSPPLPSGSRAPAPEPGEAVIHESTIAPITEPVEVVSPLSGDRGDFSDVGGDAPSEELFASRSSVGTEDVVASTTDPVRNAADPPGDDRGALDPTETPHLATEDLPVDEALFVTERARPTGSARMGRARRNGLLPARMRAKRPDDADTPTDAPLAAEPPGASVTEVPGAGRKRGSVASLAAADRSADRDGGLSPDGADEAGPARPVSDGVDMAATAAVAAGVPRRRPKRRSLADRATDPNGGPRGPGPTGGGPPTPRRPRITGTEAPSSRNSHDGGSSIGLRVGTGLAVAAVALLAFKLGTVTSLVLCMIVVTFAAGECFSVLRRAGYHPATLLGLVGTISLLVGAYSKGVAALPLVLVMITAFTLIWYLCGIETGSPVAGTAATLLTVGWVSLLGAYAALLLSPSTFPHRHGIAFLLGAIIATVANDVGALVAGGWMGRHPLAPSISPNKTWEGLVGGTVVTIVVSTVVVGAIHPWTPANAALLGVVVAVVAPIGDLCESLLKRDLRLKDMGTLLPGHGGVLDRVDALLFVLPATYYLVRALNIG
jgi:CDP-diglyceride synthetase